jgi:hypothetical protein
MHIGMNLRKPAGAWTVTGLPLREFICAILGKLRPKIGVKMINAEVRR